MNFVLQTRGPSLRKAFKTMLETWLKRNLKAAFGINLKAFLSSNCKVKARNLDAIC